MTTTHITIETDDTELQFTLDKARRLCDTLRTIFAEEIAQEPLDTVSTYDPYPYYLEIEQ